MSIGQLLLKKYVVSSNYFYPMYILLNKCIFLYFRYFEEAKHFSLKRLLPNTERPGKKKKKKPAAKPAAKPVVEPVEVKPKREPEPLEDFVVTLFTPKNKFFFRNFC